MVKHRSAWTLFSLKVLPPNVEASKIFFFFLSKKIKHIFIPLMDIGDLTPIGVCNSHQWTDSQCLTQTKNRTNQQARRLEGCQTGKKCNRSQNLCLMVFVLFLFSGWWSCPISPPPSPKNTHKSRCGSPHERRVLPKEPLSLLLAELLRGHVLTLPGGSSCRCEGKLAKGSRL